MVATLQCIKYLHFSSKMTSSSGVWLQLCAELSVQFCIYLVMVLLLPSGQQALKSHRSYKSIEKVPRVLVASV